MSDAERAPITLETLEVELPNGSDGDSLVLLRFRHLGRCLLFDAGDPHRLSRRDLGRLDHLFVSHCHVDHFIGFDQLVRPRVCLEESMTAHGPPGFLDRVEARLAGYDWNLADGNHFIVTAREIRSDVVKRARFDSGGHFRRQELSDEPIESDGRGVGVAFHENDFTVETAALDHHIVSQAWAVQMAPRIHVRDGALEESGLPPGPWLASLKQAVLSGGDRTKGFDLPDGTRTTIDEVAARLLAERRGERFCYVTDTLFADHTRPRIVALASGADVLACEAPFLSEEVDKATRSRHLTAAQAGQLAGEAGVKTLLLFHVSDRYQGDFSRHLEEARRTAGPSVDVQTRSALERPGN